MEAQEDVVKGMSFKKQFLHGFAGPLLAALGLGAGTLPRLEGFSLPWTLLLRITGFRACRLQQLTGMSF